MTVGLKLMTQLSLISSAGLKMSKFLSLHGELMHLGSGWWQVKAGNGSFLHRQWWLGCSLYIAYRVQALYGPPLVA